jgi:hypothetical protein
MPKYEVEFDDWREGRKLSMTVVEVDEDHEVPFTYFSNRSVRVQVEAMDERSAGYIAWGQLSYELGQAVGYYKPPAPPPPPKLLWFAVSYHMNLPSAKKRWTASLSADPRDLAGWYTATGYIYTYVQAVDANAAIAQVKQNHPFP